MLAHIWLEFNGAFIVLVKFQFSILGPVTLHSIRQDRQVFFQRRTVNMFLSISPNICFGAQMNRLLETALLRGHS